MKTKFLGYKGKFKKYELEFEQKDCDEMNELAKKLGLDKMPDYKPSIPSKEEFLFG